MYTVLYQNMNKEIKFYPNHEDNMHCSQAVFRSLFNYFFDEELSWEEIEAITKTIPGKGAWTMAAEIELAKRGVEVINIEPFDYEKYYNEGVDYLKNNFDESTVNYYLEKSNLLSVHDDIPLFLQLVKHETRRAGIEDIDSFLSNGYLIGAEINSRILNKREGFSLHYVLIREGKNQSYIINDPGAPPIENREVTKEEFIQALGKEGSNGEVTAFRK
jgi:hypothetical protein